MLKRVLGLVILMLFALEVLEPSDNFVRAYDPNVNGKNLSSPLGGKIKHKLNARENHFSYFFPGVPTKESTVKSKPIKHRSVGAVVYKFLQLNQKVTMVLSMEPLAPKVIYTRSVYHPPISA